MAVASFKALALLLVASWLVIGVEAGIGPSRPRIPSARGQGAPSLHEGVAPGPQPILPPASSSRPPRRVRGVNERLVNLRSQIMTTKQQAFAELHPEAFRKSDQGLAHFLDEKFELPPQVADSRGEMRRVLRNNAQKTNAVEPLSSKVMQGVHADALRRATVYSNRHWNSLQPSSLVDTDLSRDEKMHHVKMQDEHMRYHAMALYEHARAGGASAPEAAHVVQGHLSGAKPVSWMNRYRGDQPPIAQDERVW